jgi:hypothetical protein
LLGRAALAPGDSVEVQRTRGTETEISLPRARAALLAAAALLATTALSAGDQEYSVSGDDVYRIGSTAPVARITYEGTERLSIERVSGKTRYTAVARYTRNGDDGKANVQARFVQVMTPRGTFEDEVDEDPDFLTVLNQPFAIQLDAPTLHDLRTLHGKVPFEASSPLGGDSVLRGFLRPATAGEIDGTPVVAVKFEAEGVMAGALPAHGAARMTGQMRMEGTAYYSAGSALLLALDATLTIVAQLQQDAQSRVPVRIVYRRSIRADAGAKTPLPTPLATDAGTVSPATP